MGKRNNLQLVQQHCIVAHMNEMPRFDTMTVTEQVRMRTPGDGRTHLYTLRNDYRHPKGIDCL
jgi:hypothetical protein